MSPLCSYHQALRISHLNKKAKSFGALFFVSIAILSQGAMGADPISSTSKTITFTNRANALPQPHIYSGEWEFFVGGGVAIFDCNNDNFPDLYTAGGEHPARLFINTTQKSGAGISFTSPKPGAEQLKNVTGAYPIDIDSDGILDLAVLRFGKNVLLKGEGNCHFHDATAEWGFETADRWSTSFTATWEKGHDWPTIAIGNYVDTKNPKGPFGACDVNELHRGALKHFNTPEIISPGYCALSMLISDWKRNGIPDLRISNDRHYYVREGYEQMFALNPLQEYTEQDGWPHIKLWGMGISSRDINGDGLPEVFLTSMADQLLQINKGNGVMENAPYKIGTYASRPYLGDDGRPSTGWHAEFGDVNNDALVDLFIAKGNVDQMPSNAIHDPNNLLIQQENGSFSEKGDLAGIATMLRSRGAGLADLNLDGRLDIVVVNRRAPIEIWQNESQNTQNWLLLDIRQSGANSRAVGSWVELRTPKNQIQSQEITIGGGHASGKATPLHFGLGNATEAELRVIWPDHSTSDWHPIKANQFLQISKNENSFHILKIK